MLNFQRLCQSKNIFLALWVLILLLVSQSQGLFVDEVQAQDLLGERIRKIEGHKKSVYLDQGIFHNGSPKRTSTVKAIRHSFSKKRGFERLVFDFSTNKIPRIYGHYSRSNKKLYVDFFNTDLSTEIGSFGNSPYVKSINFFPIEKDDISLEVILKDKASIEIFYLSNPGRLVVDIK